MTLTTRYALEKYEANAYKNGFKEKDLKGGDVRILIANARLAFFASTKVSIAIFAEI